MGSVEKANEAAEQVAKTTQESYRSMVDYGTGLQERNVRFMQEMVEGSVKELRYQAESNRAITQQFIERAEKQRDAVQTMFEESLDAYMDLLYFPLTHYKQSLEAAKKATR